MKNIKTNINNIKLNIIAKIKKLKEKIIHTEKVINTIKVNTLVWYGSIIFLWGILIWVNMSNFIVSLSTQYPQLNIKTYNQTSSLKQVSELLSDSLDNNSEFNIELNSAIEKSNNNNIIENPNNKPDKITIKKETIDNSQNNILKELTIITKEKKTYTEEVKEKIIKDTKEEISEKVIEEKVIGKDLIEEDLIEEKVIIKEKNKEEEEELKKEIALIPLEKKEDKKTEEIKIVEEIKESLIKDPVKEEIKVVVNSNTDIISISNTSKINNILKDLNIELYNWFNIKLLKNNNLVLEDWIWYTYIYSEYKNFGKWFNPTETDLSRNWFNKDTTLLLLDENQTIFFVTDYKKVKLISDYIIAWVTNKQNFLKELSDDKRYLHSDTDELFKKLKTETLNITNWNSNSAKKSILYDYILKNISYSTTFSTSNKEIFSWINTYENKDWICWGYSKLYLYMLSFAWVSDVRVVKWDVIDAADFPNIGHAWVQIGYNYYDPTFDDPNWALKTKTYSDYKYFALPRDLFYTNRYNYWTLPSYLKTESLESRENIIKENLSKLSDKYKNTNYLLLQPFTFRYENNLVYNEQITVDKLKEILPYYEVSDYKIIKDNQEKIISDLKFYTVNNSNIESLLDQIKYNLEWYKLLKWDNWSYRLTYQLYLN